MVKTNTAFFSVGYGASDCPTSRFDKTEAGMSVINRTFNRGLTKMVVDLDNIFPIP